ncbi:hypothetical protein SKAU_G00296510 [Synaphobranchus kaupii]|uniref:Uncharacterized protein n=1 Tax=Synaphobranchus kaupii TaxID=118154 RepID=A0A9Q1EUV2_SYNKA|nr:hypothetical protein SKAU_G00296510 [Synaphobranchus kaupii]
MSYISNQDKKKHIQLSKTMDATNFLYLFILCSAQSFCKGCEWIQHGFRQVSGESLSLLSEMADEKVKFLHESIDQIIKLLNGNLDSATWNRLKLDHFLTVLDRQSRELQKCVSSASKYERRLNRYFRKLKKNVLKKRGDFPQQCINENVLITFPRSAFASNGSSDSDSVRTAINQTLHSINCLFENNDLPTEWDEIKLIEDFQAIVYRQVGKSKCGDFPQQCINENVLITFPRSAFASNGSSDSDSVRTAINQTLHSINCLFENNDLPTEWDEIKLIEDFQAIVYRQVGKSKCNSFCAWEIVRKELVYTLQFIIEHGSDSLRWPKRI